MAANRIPSADYLREILDYNPETGELKWKPKRPDMFNDGGWWKYRPEAQCARYNEKRSGKIADYQESQKYRCLYIDGKSYKSHRVIWCIVTGRWPSGQIDHINGVRDDNRWNNLRDVPKLINAKNQRKHKTNTSGVTGVSYVKHISKYIAYIGSNNKMIRIGYYETLEEAAKARKEAEIKHGFHPNHGQNPHVQSKTT